MKKIIVLFIYLCLIITGINKMFAQDPKQITITILYNNYVYSEGVKADWGFSCLIEGTEKKILFDTGTKSEKLFHNIDKPGIKIDDVELIHISHNHGDHTGGLFAVLAKNNNVSVYLPISFPDEFIQKVEKNNAKVISVDESVKICKDVFSTGEMGVQIKEHSMIINTSKGLILITGCSHPGIVDIIKRSEEILNKQVYLVFGGFHLGGHTNSQVEKIISEFKDLGVLKVGATHCTGDRAIELFKKAFGENYIQMGVGKILKLSE